MNEQTQPNTTKKKTVTQTNRHPNKALSHNQKSLFRDGTKLKVTLISRIEWNMNGKEQRDNKTTNDIYAKLERTFAVNGWTK